jgi:hypothetical protein
MRCWQYTVKNIFVMHAIEVVEANFDAGIGLGFGVYL